MTKRTQNFIFTLVVALSLPGLTAVAKTKEKQRILARDPIYLCQTENFAAPIYRIDLVQDYKHLYASSINSSNADARQFLASYKPAGAWYELVILDPVTKQIAFQDKALEIFNWSFLGMQADKDVKYDQTKYGHTYFVLSKDNDNYGGKIFIAIDVGTGETAKFVLDHFPIVKKGNVDKVISDNGEKYSCARMPNQKLIVTEKTKKVVKTPQQVQSSQPQQQEEQETLED